MGTWTRRDRDNVLLALQWEEGTPVPSRHRSKGDRLTIMDPDGRRLMQDSGGPDFWREEKSPISPAPANLVGKYVAQGQNIPPHMPYFSLELDMKPDFTLNTTMLMPDQKTTYTGVGKWARSGPFEIMLYVTWQKGTPELPGHPNDDRLSIVDDGQRFFQDFGGPLFYRVQ